MQQTMETQTLLIVEDDDVFRERLGRSMERRGLKVRTAAGVREAVHSLENELPDLAIIDLRLEDGSGLSVIEALKQKEAPTRSLMLTSYGDIPTAVAAVLGGAIDYMAKPATADEIFYALMTRGDEHAPPPQKTFPPEAARREHIQQIYRQADGNVSKAARLLKMHRRTLQRTLKRHGMTNEATS